MPETKNGTIPLETNLEYVVKPLIQKEKSDHEKAHDKAHNRFQEYFKKSVTEKFINPGIMPNKAEHRDIMDNLKARREELRSFEDQNTYFGTAWSAYKKFAVIRILEDFIQGVISKGEIPDGKRQDTLSDLFKKARKSLDKHQENNPSLKQEYEKVSNDYLKFVETKQEEEEPAETTYSSIKPDQKEKGTDDLIESGKIPTEEEANQRKDDLDCILSQIPNQMEPRPGELWKIYPTVHTTEESDYKMRILKEMPDGSLHVKFLPSGREKEDLHKDAASEMLKEKMEDKKNE